MLGVPPPYEGEHKAPRLVLAFFDHLSSLEPLDSDTSISVTSSSQASLIMGLSALGRKLKSTVSSLGKKSSTNSNDGEAASTHSSQGTLVEQSHEAASSRAPQSSTGGQPNRINTTNTGSRLPPGDEAASGRSRGANPAATQVAIQLHKAGINPNPSQN